MTKTETKSFPQIVDVHSHAWRFPDDMSEDFRRQAIRGRADVKLDLRISLDEYRAKSRPNVKTVVFGGKAKLSGVWVDDAYVAKYCEQDSKNLIPFLCVDPTQDGWLKEMRDGHEVLGMRGIKLLPMYAGFYPQDERLDPLWRYATRKGLPVLLHTGTTFVAQAPLDCTLPRHLDVVATRFPDVRIILAHIGHPYEGEAIVTIRKHDNVYADISALHYRPWQLYHSLMLTQEYGVWHKLLFGTDYPFTSVNSTIEGLHNLNKMVEGTALPRLDVKKIEELIYRDSLKLLGLSN